MGSLGATTRIAWRLAGRRRARNALIATMITLPVAGIVAAAVVVQSGVPTLDEHLDYTLGHSEAQLFVIGPPGPREQYPLEPYSTRSGGEADSDADVVTDPSLHLPRGTELVRVDRGLASVRTERAAATVDVVMGEVWAPELDGAYSLLDGRAPRTDDEVLVTPGLLEAFDLAIGDRMEVVDPRGEWTVVGTMRKGTHRADEMGVFVRPGVVAEAADPVDAGVSWYVLDAPLDWDTVRDLNREGIVAFSRAVAAQFPDTWEKADWRQASANAVIGVAAVAGGFGVLQVGLLAGAAFAVGARQEQRLLALIAVTGADRRALVRVVTLGGVVLGAIAALLALPLGVGAAVLFMALDSAAPTSQYPGLHIPWPIVVGIVASAVLVGWISAAVPARAASRVDLLRALRGARSPAPPPRRVPVAGVVLAVVGVGVTVAAGIMMRLPDEWRAAAMTSRDETFDPEPSYWLDGIGTALVVIGGALVIFGAIACCGAVLRLVARIMRGGGPTARIATRDLLRNRSRAVPAIAASLTATFVFAIVVSSIHTIEESQSASYRYQLPLTHARLSLATSIDWATSTVDWADATEAAAARRAIEESLPVREAGVIDGADEWLGRWSEDPDATFGEPGVGLPRLEPPTDSICPLRRVQAFAYELRSDDELVGADPRCADVGVVNVAGLTNPKMQVGSVADLELLLGRRVDEATRAALADDIPIALSPHYLGADGRLRIAWYDSDILGSSAPDALHVATPVAHLLPASEGQPWYGVFLSPAAADQLGIDHRPMAVYAALDRRPTDTEVFEAYRAAPLAMGATNVELYIENGPTTTDPLVVWALLGAAGIITLAAALAALGLARIEARADDATLAAIGAGRGMRRRIAFVQAVVLIGTGGMLGTAASLTPLAAIALGTPGFGFAPPWEQLAVLAVGLPLVVGMVSFLVTRSPGSVRRRAAIA